MSATYYEARGYHDPSTSTDDSLRNSEFNRKEALLQRLRTILSTNNIDELIAADKRLGAEDSCELHKLGQKLCEDAPALAHESHGKRWRILAERAKMLYDKDAARVEFVKWVELTAWYLKSIDLELQRKARGEAKTSSEDDELPGVAPAA